MQFEEIPEEQVNLLRAAVGALDDKKAEDLKVLYLGQKSSITDFYILANGNSDPHLRALSNALFRQLKDLQVNLVGTDSEPGSGWTVVDAFDVMIHLFLPEQRKFYQLDELWKDADALDPQAFLTVGTTS